MACAITSPTLTEFITRLAAHVQTFSGKDVNLNYEQGDNSISIAITGIRQGEIKNYKEYTITLVYNSTSGQMLSDTENSFNLYSELNQTYRHDLTDLTNVITEMLTEYMNFRDRDTHKFSAPMIFKIWTR